MNNTKSTHDPQNNGKDAGHLPEHLTPEMAQAVLEDRVMQAAADIAALSATLEARTDSIGAPSDLLMSTIAPETPEEMEILELIGVPLLGPARARALADIGIRTLADLHAASAEQIGGVKGIGVSNARRIKDWVSKRATDNVTNEPSVNAEAAPEPAAVPTPATPPPPPSVDVPPASAPDSAGAESLDPACADVNQHINDELGEIDEVIARLTEKLSAKGRAKRLRRQLDRISSVASELAEGPDTLSTEQVQQALQILDRITELLHLAVEDKDLFGKKKRAEKMQEKLRDVLRDQRRALQKTLGD